MVRYLQTRGVTRVVWIDPYPVRLPSWRDLRRPHTRIHRERPANGAVSAIPSVEAVTVRLAKNSEIPNTCRKTGRIGWVA